MELRKGQANGVWFLDEGRVNGWMAGVLPQRRHEDQHTCMCVWGTLTRTHPTIPIKIGFLELTLHLFSFLGLTCNCHVILLLIYHVLCIYSYN